MRKVADGFSRLGKGRYHNGPGAGETAIAPLIISASRATDIPAFYPDWFIRRLETGYCKWVNPFSGKPLYVSLTKARFVVFWSKNPAPMIPRLPILDERRIGWYFQFTLNDYEQEGFEPNVPPLKERVETFQRLAGKAGRERVVWRFDPLIRTASLGPEELLEKIRRVGERIHPFTEKLVISFADIGGYAKVKRNLNVAGVPWKDFTREDMEKIAQGAAALGRGWGLEVATCAESVDFDRYGIVHNRCIDPELIMRIARSDEVLRGFLGCEEKNASLLAGSKTKHPLKDKGQRKHCGCIVSKDIGRYDTCEHLCVYCYANGSPELVKRNRGRMRAWSDSILGESTALP